VNVSRRLAGFQPSALSAAAIAGGFVPAACSSAIRCRSAAWVLSCETRATGRRRL